ncbi:MAG: efflux RND transporter periplasmic adaptor subunit [bacterium]|nr:efflux RND transporter periplasmic adaptor subunit [bacterium]
MKKAILILVAIAVAGFLGWRVYKKASASPKGAFRRRGAMAVAVDISPVQKTTIRDVGLFSGTLLPKSQFIVSPKIPGRLEKLFVNIGNPVKRGNLIALLDSEEFFQQAEQARAELDVAAANVEESFSALGVAQRELERVQTLREKKIASEAELDSAQAQCDAQDAKYRVTLAQVTQKEAALNAAQVRFSYTQIRALWEDGDEPRIVGERFVDEGEMLRANDPIVSVLEIHLLTAVIHVIERDYSQVRTGQEAVITTDAFPEKSFPGTIVRVAPILRETSRQARVEIEVANAQRLLKPGMFIRAEIEFAKHDDATVVPVAALARRGGQQGVFLADTQKRKALFVPVTLGITHNGLAEVLKPPLSGEVVTLGQHLLEDGSAIILPRE